MNKRTSKNYKIFELFAEAQQSFILSNEAKAQTKQKVLRQVAITPQEQPEIKGPSSMFGTVFNNRRYLLAVCLVLIIGTVSPIAYGANLSIPGEPLYRVKQALEKTLLQSTFTDSGKSHIEAYQASERIEELYELRQQKKEQLIPQAEEAANTQYNKAVEHLTRVQDKLTEKGNTTAAEKIGKRIESLNNKAQLKGFTVKEKNGTVQGATEKAFPGNQESSEKRSEGSTDNTQQSPTQDLDPSTDNTNPSETTKAAEQTLKEVVPQELQR